MAVKIEQLFGVRGVGSSNLPVPTIIKISGLLGLPSCLEL
jgi:hypothetical protein